MTRIYKLVFVFDGNLLAYEYLCVHELQSVCSSSLMTKLVYNKNFLEEMYSFQWKLICRSFFDG